MPRPQNEPPPRLSLEDAISAASAIKTLRRKASDPDIAFFPPVIRDDGDIVDVLDYVQSYRRVPHPVRQAEIVERFRLIEYLRQQETRRRVAMEAQHNKRLLTALNEARRLTVSSAKFRHIIGLTRSGVGMLRDRLTAEVRGEREPLPTPPRQRAAEDRLDQWLTKRRRELTTVLAAFADRREDVVHLLSITVADPDIRNEVLQGIDHWAETMPPQPSRQHASLVAYTAHLLRQEVLPPHGLPLELTDQLGLAAKLREEYLQVRPPQH